MTRELTKRELDNRDPNNYYFPSQTDNVVFVKKMQYLCLSDVGGFVKGEKYTCEFFQNIVGDPQPIYFSTKPTATKLKGLLVLNPYDLGHFVSIKKHRLKKLKKLNEYKRID